MTRTSKPAAQRRDEILDVAQHLFITKGVQATSVEDILKEVGIAKGTLYYHFSSKEEILRSLISRTTTRAAQQAQAAAQEPGPAVPRLLAVLAAGRVAEPELELAQELHASGNAEFHILSIVEMVRALTGIVEQGVTEGVFDTDHPREVVEILLVSAGMLLDDGIFTGEQDELARRAAGVAYAAETLLGCRPGTLAPALEGLS